MLFVVAAAMVDARGRVLVQRRPPGKPMAGLWEFPGGKVDPGESPEAALSRELAEELGTRVAHSSLSPIAFASEPLGDRHLVLLLYVTRAWEGEPQAHHASELQWIAPDRLAELEMPPADKPLIAALEALL